MPLPPRKLKNTGNSWPKKTATPMLAIKKLPVDNSDASDTASHPFRASKTNTVAANGLPAIRKTLVAPGLFEPRSLGSGKFNQRHNKMALETEPNR